MVEHDCPHEQQILGQSRAIERINAELNYKKEKLDDLKEDNKRMETKIDDIKDCINQLIVKSNADDSKLETRLQSVETKIDDLEKKVDDHKQESKDHTNQVYVRLGLVVSGISVFIGLLFHLIR